MLKRNTKIAVASLLVAILAGCTIRVTGEASILKKYDRPGEVYNTMTQDIKEGCK